MIFEASYSFFPMREPEVFTDKSVPKWVESWFWQGYVSKLPINGTIDTDFRVIRRVG